MAFRINQTFLLGFLCIALLFSSGLAQDFDLPGTKCQKGKCVSNTQCAQSCVRQGFKRGGTCEGVVPGIIICCCFT
ncbi:hypothetical protein PHAVU_008G145000 [Phaseolus vulgaris]